MFTQVSVASVATLKIKHLCSRMISSLPLCFLVLQKRGFSFLDAVLPHPLTPYFVSPSGSTVWHPHEALRRALTQHFVRWGKETGWTNFGTDYRKNAKWNATKTRSAFGYFIKYLYFSRKMVGAIIYFRKMKREYLIFITFVFKKRQNEWNLEWNMFWVKSLYSK